MTIADIEQALTAALKQKDTTTVSTLRMLLSRLKNDRIAGGGELTNDQVLGAIQSEQKKRKEAEAEYVRGNRPELAEAEAREAAVLAQFLPPQATEAEIVAVIEEMSAQHGWSVKDFGAAMKVLKERFGASADGGVLSKILKEKLK